MALALCQKITECNLDAETQTEWQLSLVGIDYERSDDVITSTTFNYRIVTLKDSSDPRCTSESGNCQDLSHWVIITDCPGGSGAGDPGKDGSVILPDGSVPYGYKWDIVTAQDTMDFSLTFPGLMSSASVEYLVKGSTRCGLGQIEGPVCNGENPPPSPEEPEEEEEECVVSECADDGFSCTVTSCVNGECDHVPNDELCVVENSCLVYQCQPGDGSDARGCVEVDVDHSVCQAGAPSCTNNFCVPSSDAGARDSRGCARELFDDRCQDAFSCTLNVCNPDAEDADKDTGCTIAYQDAVCDDGATCSDNVCNPADTTRSDGSGCVDTLWDSRCVDDNVCTDDFCRPSDPLRFAASGCVEEANTAPCDDGDECTGTVEDPDQCADMVCVSGGMVCPYFTGDVFAGQYFPAGSVVATNNETHVLLRWNAGESGWVTSVIHVYVSDEAPSSLSPGRFSKIVTLASPVSELLVTVPLPDACLMDGPVYFAFHMEAVSGDGLPICIERNGGESCSGVTETGWFKGDYKPPRTRSWGSYATFESCCCAGFSHVDQFLAEDSSVEILYSTSAKAATANPEDMLIEAIADILEIPASAVQVISYDYRMGSNLEDAVIRFVDVDGVSAGTLARQLASIPTSTFATYGIQVDTLAVVPNVNDYVNVGGNLYSDSSDATKTLVFFSSMLSAILLLL